MRTIWMCVAAAIFAWPPAAHTEGLESLSGQVTFVVDAERPLPSRAILAMREEMQRLFSGSRLRFQWADRREAGLGWEADGIFVVRLRGECRMPELPMLPDGARPAGVDAHQRQPCCRSAKSTAPA